MRNSARAYAFLLSDGSMTPWHKTPELMRGQSLYRRVWERAGLRPVAIIRAREKSDWERALWGIPAGLWVPMQVGEQWQAVRLAKEPGTTTITYDVVEEINYSGRERKANLYESRTGCELRCFGLNVNYACTIRDLRNPFGNVENFGDHYHGV